MSGDSKVSKARDVRAMFSAIAGYYDLINSLLSFRCDRAWRRFAASKSGVEPGALVLDIATGTGELARQLYRHNSESRIVGVDFCPDMLRKARAKFVDSSGASIVELVLGDALLLPFRGSTFDCVTIGFGLRNVNDISAAFREIARVIKPGGRVVTLELTRPKSSLVRKLHSFGLFHIVPHIGRLVSGNREAYTYLPDSIVGFPSPDEVKKTMEEAGLQEVEIYPLILGIATVHVAVKR